MKRLNNYCLYRRYFKRPIDIFLSLIAIILLLPVTTIVALLVRIFIGRPIFFRQQRPGINEKVFTLYKFRTMKDSKDEKGILLPDKSRLNRFGKYLRSYSLDELPELFNILKGDMAVVGPRPLLIKDIVFMTHKQLQRYSIKPGLTGLAQINGRNDILWEKKLYLDLVYVNNITIKNDLRIILKTIVKSFKQEGINTKGMATAEDLGDYLLRIKKINYREYYSGIEKFQIISNSLLKSKTIN